MKSGNILFCKGHNKTAQVGVGFLINKELASNIENFKAIDDRLISIALKLNKKFKIQIIQVYAPTSTYDDEIIE